MRFLVLCLLLLPATAQAQSLVRFADVVRFAAGVQGAWYDEDAYPSDLEVGGTVAGSLQPRTSLVGAAFYGVGETYIRASVGGRYCVSNPDDVNFSSHIGVQYHVSSNEALRPQEWAGDVSVGWRPRPADLPAVILIAQGSYGFESTQAAAYVWGSGSARRPAMNDLKGFLLWVATNAMPAIVGLLERLKAQFPDMVAAIDKLLLGIRDGLAPEHVVAAILDFPEEVLAAIKLEFNPRFHPGDLA